MGLVKGTNRGSKWRGEDDHFPTPPEAIYPLLRTVPLPQTIWEPAAGEGHISRVLEAHGHHVVSTTLVDRGFGVTGVDFLRETALRATCIVTNPPFSLDDEFTRHALDMKPDMLCLFMRLKYLCGAARYSLIHGPNPPFLVLPFIERIRFYAGDMAEEEQPGWNTEDFAWFIWRNGYRGRPSIQWLSRDDGSQADLLRDFMGAPV